MKGGTQYKVIVFLIAVSLIAFLHQSNDSFGEVVYDRAKAENEMPDFKAIAKEKSIFKTANSRDPLNFTVSYRNMGEGIDLSNYNIFLIYRGDEAHKFANSNWLSEDILKIMDQGVVKSASDFEIHFTLDAPALPGSYDLNFALYEEGRKKVPFSDFKLHIEVQAHSDVRLNPFDYEAKIHGSFNREFILRPGELREIKLSLMNTGKAPWYGGGERKMILNTADPISRPSVFYVEDDWFSVSSVASLIEKYVAKGSVGTFSFKLRAPKEVGTYKESFVLYNEELGVLGDFVLDFDIEVKKMKDKFDRYIEVDLSEQMLSIHEDGEILGNFQISSGSKYMATPEGVFKILSKEEEYWSRTYKMTLPYWMHFSGLGHGFHELPIFQNGQREGENHLGIPVSHGCVRLGIGPAKELFDWAEIGDKVVVHD